MKKGFTLIELLVVTSIISIITGGGLASYVQFNNKEKLKAAALEVKTYLRKAQANALAGVKNEEECEARPLDGWCLDLYHGPAGPGRPGYLYGHCGGPVADPPVNADFDREEFTLPAGVSISFDPPYGGILLFKPLGQGVNLGPVSGNNLTICLSASSLGVSSSYKLTVTTSGEITDDGFVSSCP